MNTNVHFASLGDTIDHVRELMAAKRIHAVPVVGKKRKLLGIVTTADLARNLDGGEPVSHVMSELIATIAATASVGQAARRMREHRVHHLVVSDKGNAVGIISSYDLLRLFELMPRDAKGVQLRAAAEDSADMAERHPA
jgi:CBS domain-containing protein